MSPDTTTRTLARIALCALTGALLATVLTGCGTPTAGAGSSGASESASLAADPAKKEPTVPENPALHVSTEKVTGNEEAVISTAKGEIRIAFYPDKAPNTVASFIELAKQGYFDGIKFHRVVPSFVVQGGDPYSRTDDPRTGTGGPGWRQKAEFNDVKHVAGTVAMARTNDPDSAGSQFYIALGDLPDLDGKYTVFGHVVSGMDVVEAIRQGDVMTSVRIVEK